MNLGIPGILSPLLASNLDLSEKHPVFQRSFLNGEVSLQLLGISPSNKNQGGGAFATYDNKITLSSQSCPRCSQSYPNSCPGLISSRQLLSTVSSNEETLYHLSQIENGASIDWLIKNRFVFRRSLCQTNVIDSNLCGILASFWMAASVLKLFPQETSISLSNMLLDFYWVLSVSKEQYCSYIFM